MQPTPFALDRVQRLVQPVDRVANGVRKLRIEQQEFHDALIGQVGRIYLAIGLKRSTGPEQSDPFQILVGVDRILDLRENIAVIDIEQLGGRRGALQKTPYLQKLPSLAVAERGVGDSLEEVHAVNQAREKFGKLRLRWRVRPELRYLMKEPVQPLPLFAADLFADLTRIFPRCKDAGGYGGGLVAVKTQRLHQRIHVVLPFQVA